MNVSQDIAACMLWLDTHYPAFQHIESPLQILKSGLLPILPGSLEIMLMKPVAKHRHLTPPGWQIAKGTRMMQVDSDWKDMKKDFADAGYEQIESLACTALREGMEEVGITLKNIVSMHDLGAHVFHSASSGKQKHVAIFLCAVKNKNDFLDASEITASTAETAWFPLNALPSDTREDNIPILEFIRNTVSK